MTANPIERKEMSETRNYNRGYIERIGAKDDPKSRVHGSIQFRVKNVKKGNANGKDTFEINGFGYYSKASGIPYALGDDVLFGEKGSCSIRATAWERMAGFVEKMNIHEGDTVRVYGFFKKNSWTGQDGRTRNSIDCTVSRVEIDFRNKNAAPEVATATPTAQVNAPAPADAPAQETAPDIAGLDFESEELPF